MTTEKEKKPWRAKHFRDSDKGKLMFAEAKVAELEARVLKLKAQLNEQIDRAAHYRGKWLRQQSDVEFLQRVRRAQARLVKGLQKENEDLKDKLSQFSDELPF